MSGSKPAAYYSRGEGGAFYSALAAEEEADAASDLTLPSSSSTNSSSSAVRNSNEDALFQDETEEELTRDVEAREAERARRVNPRGGSAGFP